MRSRPTDGVPILEVRITDGAASAIVEWRGRRSIGGITLGRRLLVEGVARREGTHLVFSNPEYTLLP